MNCKLQLHALLSCCHELSHKKNGGVGIDLRTLAEHKVCQTHSCDPAQTIVPWWKMTIESEGLANWNKSIKPNQHDFKPFREMNEWVECKESFMITLEAQNLTHLVEKNQVIHDADLDEALRKFMCKAMKDDFLHPKAKTLVKKHANGKDTRLIREEACQFYDGSITTSIDVDVILVHLADVRFRKANWNRRQGESVNRCKTQKNKFNKIAPDSKIANPQAARMLQNVVSGTPSLAPALNQCRQARKAAGNTTGISFDQCVVIDSKISVIRVNHSQWQLNTVSKETSKDTRCGTATPHCP